MTLTLLFSLDETLYGLEIAAVQEIVEDPVLHQVPRAMGVLRGAINFHGQVLAVIDLPDLLGIASTQRDHRQVVLSPAFKSVVLTVGRIQRIAEIDLSELQPPPENASERAIRGRASLGEITVNLLDTDELFKKLENLYAA
jgi:purine-binding chemotaxis protein CheW